MPDGPLTLGPEDLQVRLEALPGWAAAHGTVVVLSTEVTEELLREGLAREVMHAIQSARKDAGCAYTDRIIVEISAQSQLLLRAIREHAQFIQQETLAKSLSAAALPPDDATVQKAGDERFSLRIRVV